MRSRSPDPPRCFAPKTARKTRVEEIVILVNMSADEPLPYTDDDCCLSALVFALSSDQAFRTVFIVSE